MVRECSMPTHFAGGGEHHLTGSATIGWRF
jgi:hypothetical protein